jgi:hypothetical protein
MQASVSAHSESYLHSPVLTKIVSYICLITRILFWHSRPNKTYFDYMKCKGPLSCQVDTGMWPGGFEPDMLLVWNRGFQQCMDLCTFYFGRLGWVDILYQKCSQIQEGRL